MDSSTYNKYLSAIKTANDLSDRDRAKDMLRKIQAEMVSEYGANESDVVYLIKQFRYYV